MLPLLAWPIMSFSIDGTGGQTPVLFNPNEYLFWDEAHPTAQVHAVYASEVERLIGWGQYCSS